MTREEELALLIEEQRRDDTHIIRPEEIARGALHLDQVSDNGAHIDNLVGIHLDGELIVFARPARGYVLTGGQPWHGTRDGYSNHGCRCPRCCAANTEAQLAARHRRFARGCPKEFHGTEHGYGNYGCRCDLCKEAHRLDRRERDERKLGKIEERKCSNCGTSFMPNSRRFTRYCSRRCYRDVQNTARRAKRRQVALAA